MNVCLCKFQMRNDTNSRPPGNFLVVSIYCALYTEPGWQVWNLANEVLDVAFMAVVQPVVPQQGTSRDQNSQQENSPQTAVVFFTDFHLISSYS
jgi:hypothetical protein